MGFPSLSVSGLRLLFFTCVTIAETRTTPISVEHVDLSVRG